MEIIKSHSNSQYEIIRDILRLHNMSLKIELDPTYSKGIFYKNSKGLVEEPVYKFDLTPQTEDTVQSSSDNLPLENSSIRSIMFDPPFVISGKTVNDSKEGSCKISKRFGSYFSYEELKNHYRDSLVEFHRILKPEGLLIFKLQNVISSGKQHFTHYFVMKEALKIGFYPLDEFVLISKSKMTSFGGRWKTQQHAMKYHSYFLVFRKTQKKSINYDI